MFQPVNRIKSTLLLAGLSALLCACGGSSSSSESIPNSTPPPDSGGDPTPPTTQTPEPPQTIRIDWDDTRLTVHWSQVSGADSYLVYVGADTNSELPGSVEPIEAVNSPISLSNLENTLQHQVAVAAVKDGKAGELSATQFATPVAGLNDTGIDWCLTAEAEQGACDTTAAGQDGANGRDTAALAGTLVKQGEGEGGFDFTKVQNQDSSEAICIADNHTGLVWEVKTESGLQSTEHRYTWFSESVVEGQWQGIANGGTCTGSNCDTDAYVAAVNAENVCGFNDWRLPTIDELLSIISLGVTNPSLDDEYFSNTANAWYWTASAFSPDTSLAWAIGLQFGHIYPHGKDSAHAIRLVRGEASASRTQTTGCTADKFTANDDVVTDRLTGLTWQRCSAGQRWNGTACTGNADTKTWQQALELPDAGLTESELGAAYDNGWRLPNSKELASLVHRACPDALLNNEAFPNNAAGRYWSSSPFADYTGAAWVVDFTSGAIHESSHSNRHYLRLVRGQAAQ